jgi:hypothetical protein
VRHAALEHRLLRRDVVHVRVEVVAADSREVHDVRFGHRAPVRDERVADAQLLEVLAERVELRSVGRAAPGIHSFITCVSIVGEPCTAVRCM